MDALTNYPVEVLKRARVTSNRMALDRLIESEPVDDYLDGPNSDPIANEFLEHARRPAIEKNHE
jgi:hypothetical protein